MTRDNSTLNDILDDLFHGCAFAAYVRLAGESGKEPDQEATRQLAYQLYDEALKERTTPAVRSQEES